MRNMSGRLHIRLSARNFGLPCRLHTPVFQSPSGRERELQLRLVCDLACLPFVHDPCRHTAVVEQHHRGSENRDKSEDGF